MKALDSRFKKFRPTYYEKLNNGLNEAEIDSLLTKAKFGSSITLAKLYKWKNGQNANCVDSFFRVEGLMFVPMDQAIEEKQVIDYHLEESRSRFKGKLFPIMTNGAGDSLCLKHSFLGSNLYFFLHEGYEVRKYYLNFRGFIKLVCKELSSGPFRGRKVEIEVNDIEYLDSVEISAKAAFKINGGESIPFSLSRGYDGVGIASLPKQFDVRTGKRIVEGVDEDLLYQLMSELSESILPPMELLGFNSETGQKEVDWKNRTSESSKQKAISSFQGKCFVWNVNHWQVK